MANFIGLLLELRNHHKDEGEGEEYRLWRRDHAQLPGRRRASFVTSPLKIYWSKFIGLNGFAEASTASLSGPVGIPSGGARPRRSLRRDDDDSVAVPDGRGMTSAGLALARDLRKPACRG
jgi:hypothetical protein